MNRKQKATLIKFTTVIVITIIAIFVMVNLKDWVNRSEAVRAMEQLSQLVLQYREKHGSSPPEYYINSIKEKLQGHGLWVYLRTLSTPSIVVDIGHFTLYLLR